MVRTYNIGTECYALLISHTDPEFLLPVKIVILEKYTLNSKVTYKVKVKEIFESDFDYLKKHLYGFRVAFSLKNTNQNILIKVDKLETIKSMSDLLTYLNTKPFFVEDNYITLDKNGAEEYLNFPISRVQSVMIRELLGEKNEDKLIELFNHFVDAEGIEHNINFNEIKGLEISL